MYLKRIDALREKLTENSALLVKNNANVMYLSGLMNTEGLLLISKESFAYFADSRYIEYAKNTLKYGEAVLFTNLFESVNDYLAEHNIKELYFEGDTLTFSEVLLYKEKLNVSINDGNEPAKKLYEMREIKDESEIKSIKLAQEITDSAFSYILDRIKVGATEREIALDLEFFMRKSGSEGMAFDVIAVSGKNSSLPHGVPSNKKIEKGDFLTLDFGAVYGGYRSDMTRTVAIGNITNEQREVYNIVLSAQKAALAGISADKKCCDIDKAARDVIDNAGFKGCFGHALGHSVGLNIHETPNLSPKSVSVLKSGNVVTVEPGIYIENTFGVRIEDMVVVRENGIENLTKSTKELIII